jgi:hypothetical protein
MSPEISNDHDVLIELRTEMRGLRSDVQDMRTGITARVLNLESNSVSKIQFDDHETRIRGMEGNVAAMAASSKTWRYILSISIALATILSTIVGVLFNYRY